MKDENPMIDIQFDIEVKKRQDSLDEEGIRLTNLALMATLTRPIENQPIHITVHCSLLNYIMQEKNQLRLG